MIGTVVVLVSTSLTSPAPVLVASVIPVIFALDQANVAPVVALVAVYPKVDPLQIVGGAVELLSTGVGFTVTVTV